MVLYTHVPESGLNNIGEKKVLERIKKIYSNVDRNCYLYSQVPIGFGDVRKVPDFILLDPLYGVCILEVKHYDFKNTKLDMHNTYFADGNKDINPILKGNEYFDRVQDILRNHKELYESSGKLAVTLCSKVVFTKSTTEDIAYWGMRPVLENAITKYIAADELETITIERLFNNRKCKLRTGWFKVTQGVLFPERVIRKNKPTQLTDYGLEVSQHHVNEELIKELDYEQEQIARRMPYGHYMVTGVPGSGKTVILLARAVHLLRQNPNWNILILTYNKSLSKKLNENINNLKDYCKALNIPLENIGYKNKIGAMTFHQLAMALAGPQDANGKSSDWWDSELPKLAMNNAEPMFDAILIDEYQDFHADWLRLCLMLCKKHRYLKKGGGRVETTNLFLAGDRLQSIYQPNDHSWKDLGINIVGGQRSKFLRKAYRSGKSHMELAMKFLMSDDSLKNEVMNFYECGEDIECAENIVNQVQFIEGNYQSIVTLVDDMIDNERYKPEEILILCKNRKSIYDLYNLMSPELRQKGVAGKNLTPGKFTITTYHSSKGLESPVCILADVSEFSNEKSNAQEKKLLYVGMTRASEILYVHAKEYESDTCARDLKELQDMPYIEI
ncbi:hypothetical protein HNP88_000656 [Methanococcus maripaludis]|uniref:DNA helicase n=1 Tax=Methanococcus maripaludis TaxID=39152 RepID=A0A7J9NMJ1_METMI|nr:nuclease-related domain-containing DEAD/DEAH box helicase [Methanococcus maripaludis]MBA2846472.1 hypothetical protein [Methanococcus maripaludis]